MPPIGDSNRDAKEDCQIQMHHPQGGRIRLGENDAMHNQRCKLKHKQGKMAKAQPN